MQRFQSERCHFISHPLSQKNIVPAPSNPGRKFFSQEDEVHSLCLEGFQIIERGRALDDKLDPPGLEAHGSRRQFIFK